MCDGTVNDFFILFLQGVLTVKVVYQTCCSIDVHKSFLAATIIKTISGIEPSYQKKRFSTLNNSILQFKNWLLKMNAVMSVWNLLVNIRPLINDFLRKWQNFACSNSRCKCRNKDQVFMVKPAAMISLPRAVTRYL